MCKDKECDFCFNMTFASCDKSQFWSDENECTPIDVFKSATKKYKFNCDCGHSFEMSLGLIISGQWCQYCRGNRFCDDEDCEICFTKSFASHYRAKFWSEENKCRPRYVSKCSKKKYKFNCDMCNFLFESELDNIVNRNSWCPMCKNKSEKQLFKWLRKNNFSVVHQPKYNWCMNDKTNKYLPYDFVLENFKIIIELDGDQHFKYVKFWKNDLEEIQNRDIYKTLVALENGYTVIRIFQLDVWHNKNNWEYELLKSIKKYNNPKCIFISSSNNYDKLKKFLKNTLINYF